MKTNFPIDKFKEIRTPFYYYDVELLQKTLDTINSESQKYENYHVHYAVKANANEKILKQINKNGLGCDCVSGGEVQACLDAGFTSNKIVFAGVGKADWEINLGLDAEIFCFNVESIPELEVINELAKAKNKVAKIALRVNPNVDAHTHHYITTGLNENKFGINMEQLDDVINEAANMENVEFIGLHFHIGSQIEEMEPFMNLSNRINELQEKFEAKGINIKVINVGGGLGVDYVTPDENQIPDFKSYFATFNKYLKLRPDQELHFELGRAVVCQAGSLISKALYVKEGASKKFVILDAGMSDLIRPALYEAHHVIQNLSSDQELETYDVVGPICESSDCFGKDEKLNKTKRGDYFALRSAGAYGQIMACQYNCRTLPVGIYSDELI
ncbi:MAG: diaminopimelate decarboxylase [Bacteroidales bacterium]|nr:diaminopimelate decarboxylase [Bacteroidales bacterium]